MRNQFTPASSKNKVGVKSGKAMNPLVLVEPRCGNILGVHHRSIGGYL